MEQQLIDWVIKFKKGDNDSRDKVIEYFYPKIKKKASRIDHTMIWDLTWAWVLRLLDAMVKFNPDKSYNFNTYAWTYIYRWMYEYLGKYKSPFDLPKTIYADVSSMNRASSMYFHKFWEYPSWEELMSMLWWWPQKYSQVYNMFNGNYYYLDMSVDYHNESKDKPLTETLTNKMIVEAIQKYAWYLTWLEKKVYNMRIKDRATFQQIWDSLWMTHQRAQLTWKKILSKIRKWLWNMKLEQQI